LEVGFEYLKKRCCQIARFILREAAVIRVSLAVAIHVQANELYAAQGHNFSMDDGRRQARRALRQGWRGA
jgi:hypothetical protein